jgi:hypothetical protein
MKLFVMLIVSNNKSEIFCMHTLGYGEKFGIVWHCKDKVGPFTTEQSYSTRL